MGKSKDAQEQEEKRMDTNGSGIQFEEACNIDKAKIKAALNRKIWTGERYSGQRTGYERLTKKEADEIVLRAYDEAVLTAVNAMHCARALEKILSDRGWKYDAKEYRKALNATQRQKKYYGENENQPLLYLVK